jgi:hypothetical protein
MCNTAGKVHNCFGVSQVCISGSNGLMTFGQCELRKCRILLDLSTLPAAVREGG